MRENNDDDGSTAIGSIDDEDNDDGPLFRPLRLGGVGVLRHRVVLAPLTRNRSREHDLVPSSLSVRYYRQRASPGGLLISEATHVSPESLAYPRTPGVWTDAQVEGWRRVTDAVHEVGGLVVCQLWHTGRVAHPRYAHHAAVNDDHDNARRRPCVSASAVPVADRRGRRGKTIDHEGAVREHGTPRALTTAEIARLRGDYVRAARNAERAGFDGVELHAAHGYLIDQFLNDNVNRRTDEYGGASVENRCRLLREVVESLITVWPADRVGVRLSPHRGHEGGYTFYGCRDSNPDVLYAHAVSTLNRYGLAYLLLTEPRWVGRHDGNHATDPGYRMPLVNGPRFRRLWDGVLLGAGGFTPESSRQAVSDGHYDAIAFGRWFIANPDLPERLRLRRSRTRTNNDDDDNAPRLNRYDRDTFYSRDAVGYVDYPSMEFVAATKKAASSAAASIVAARPEFEGMVVGKYATLRQSDVGRSLRETGERHTSTRSRL